MPRNAIRKQIKALRRRRLATNLSLGALGLQLNVHRSTLSRIETGKTKSVHPLVLAEWERIIDSIEKTNL